MKSFHSENRTGVRSHKGEAMTLPAFDLAKDKAQIFIGFTIRITPGDRPSFFMTNLLTYPAAILKKNDKNCWIPQGQR